MNNLFPTHNLINFIHKRIIHPLSPRYLFSLKMTEPALNLDLEVKVASDPHNRESCKARWYFLLSKFYFGNGYLVYCIFQ